MRAQRTPASAAKSFLHVRLPAAHTPGAPRRHSPGTLTPIVDQPDRAFMADDMRAAVKAVASLFPTAIISGRGLDKVTAFVQLSELYYAGSHGLDIAGPAATACGSSGGDSGADGESPKTPLLHQPVPWAVALMDSVHDALVARVEHITGASVEHNKFCVSVHYRLCPERWPEVEAAVDDTVAAHEQLHVTRGRKVFEVRPKVAWDKGKALLFLLEALGLLAPAGGAAAASSAAAAATNGDGSDVFSIYMGDDVSDEDAFATLAARRLGAGILVASRCKPTEARYTLRSPAEVLTFLWKLVDLGRRRAGLPPLPPGDGSRA
jgi:trehalose 6-phosphate phosphatase